MNDFFNKTRNKIIKFISFDEINPHEHWKYLINIFFILIFILILLSFYLMYQIKNQQIYQVIPTEEEKVVTVNEKLLEEVKQSFADKSIIQNETKEGLKSYKDPSL